MKLPKFEEEPFLYVISPILILFIIGVLSGLYDTIFKSDSTHTYPKSGDWVADDYNLDGKIDYKDLDIWDIDMTYKDRQSAYDGNYWDTK